MPSQTDFRFGKQDVKNHTVLHEGWTIVALWIWYKMPLLACCNDTHQLLPFMKRQTEK